MLPPAHVFARIAAVVFFATACSDDDGDSPTMPPDPSGDDPWPAETIVGAPSFGGFLSVAISGSRHLAVGASLPVRRAGEPYTPFFAERAANGTWAPGSATLPDAGFLTAVGFAPEGQAVIAGVDLATSTGFILDERDGWSRHDLQFGGRAVATYGTVTRVGGGLMEQMYVSTAADVWTAESLPFPAATNEREIVDLDVRDGVWAACGFDDGADGTPSSPNAVLFINTTGVWERIDAPCDGCTSEQFRAVAVTEGGGLLLGGTRTDFSGGSADEYVAYLAQRSPDGSWTGIVLADAGELDRVNDILVTDRGDVYLACGMGDVVVLRTPVGAGPSPDMTLSSARVLDLAEGPDGTVWAVGTVIEGANERFAIWKRP